MNIKLTEAVGSYAFRGESGGVPIAEINVPANSTSGAKVGDVVEVRNIGTADRPRYLVEKIIEVGPELTKASAAPPAGLKYEKAATNPNAKAEPAHGKK